MLNTPSFLLGAIAGIIGLVLAMAVIVPDTLAKRIADWVVTRRNVPTMLLPFAVVGLVFGLWGIFAALAEAFVGLYIAPSVWILLVVGAALIGLWLFVRSRKPATP